MITGHKWTLSLIPLFRKGFLGCSSLHHGPLNLLPENISLPSVLATGSVNHNTDNQYFDQVEIKFKDYRQEDKVVFNIEPMGIHERGVFFTLKLAD